MMAMPDNGPSLGPEAPIAAVAGDMQKRLEQLPARQILAALAGC